MAVVTRRSGVSPFAREDSGASRPLRNGWTVRRAYDAIKIQVSTIAISLTLFNLVRLPREAFRYGDLQFLIIYTFWLITLGLPITMLQLTMGQLSQQDPVGVWRAVPILRGIGHLKILTSYLCCVYGMIYAALAFAYLIWIAKGSIPLKDCIKLHITPYGYENKMNASECFNSTFLAPFTEHPQYLGVMAILIFVLWFFVPIMLYRLRKSLTISFLTISPMILIIAIALASFLSENGSLYSLMEYCENWKAMSEPYIWHSALVQALLSTQIVSGYLISAGGTVYSFSDVRWVSTFVIISNTLSGWLWVLFWEFISGSSKKDLGIITILVLIYQSSVSERRAKEWPILAFALVLLSGVISVLTLLFPVYDKLHRLTGDQWRLYASATSAVGTALTVAVLASGLDTVALLDEMVVPVLAVFTATIEVVGFVYLYGWFYLTIDVQFVTGTRLSSYWIIVWWLIPFVLLGVTGWWLRASLRSSWAHGPVLWPVVGILITIVVIIVIFAAITVAKEEQFNLITKIASAFRPSRLWGPEEPMARYLWMSQRYSSEHSTEVETASERNNYSHLKSKTYQQNWLTSELYQRSPDFVTKNDKIDSKKNMGPKYQIHDRLKDNDRESIEKFRSPNVCIATDQLGGQSKCTCNRHFTLNVPDLRNTEVSTSL
ncbi:sodium-dependent nutrient amino acid transporter 1 [Papilio machaon]|uniref:sodium-dependent nutrient amino acid transporter 1 n=1 Tax=Papilio machaon TaxID=76193 RepID=UPI001E664D1A|nr:sodium-dependent nutrient amino acid transporter 1 [Papilio machaon]